MKEKELNKAAEEYSNTPYNYALFPVTYYEFGEPVEELEDDKSFIKDAFIAGAIWLHNEVWHSTEEEPRLNEELLLITRTAVKCLTGRYVGNGYYYLHGMAGEYTEIDKWAYIEDIIPTN